MAARITSLRSARPRTALVFPSFPSVGRTPSKIGRRVGLALMGLAFAVSACGESDSISGVDPTTQLAVSASAVNTIDVTPDSARLSVGDTITIIAEARDRRGNRLRVRASDYEWRSSNTTVARVDRRGLVRAVAGGNAVITAARGDARASTSITVGPQVPLEPGAVTDLRVVSTTSSSVTLRWTQVAGASGGPASYDLRYGPAPLSWANARPSAAVVSGTQIGTTLEHTFSGLAAGSYEFKLISFSGTLNLDAEFGEFSNVVAATVATGTSSPPATGSLVLFRSDWSTGTGTSETALRDMSKPIPWTDEKASGSGTQIVSAGSTAMTWPAGLANVMRIMNLADGSPMQGVRLLNGFATPAVGQSLFYRVYVANTTPNSYTGDSSLHPWQDGPAGTNATNWRFRIESESDGTWRPELFVDGSDERLGTGTQIQAWVLGRASGGEGGIRLNKGTVYGFELQVKRVSLTRWEPHLRVLNAAGTVIYGDNDWYRGNGNGDTLAEGHAFSFNDVNSLADLQLGANGWSSDPAQTYQAFVWGAMAVCLNDWCGPYRSGR